MSLAARLAKAGMTSDSLASVTDYLSTGYLPLDYELSGKYHDGGIPQGRMTEFAGPPSAGKTALATAIMTDAQQRGGFACFHDHENSFDGEQGKHLGLSLDPEKWLYKKVDTFEESVDLAVDNALMMRDELGPKAPIVVVFDSLASMVPKSKWDKTSKDYNMNDTTALARAVSAAFPTIAQRAERSNLTLLFLNQIRTDLMVKYGDPTKTPGGDAKDFYYSSRLRLAKAALSTKTATFTPGPEVGHGIRATVTKNKVFRPFGKATWDFTFNPDGSGSFDYAAGSVDALVTLGLIPLSGAYVEWKGKKAFKSVFIKEVRSDPALLAEVLALFP